MKTKEENTKSKQARRIRTGDTVMVITGNHKGKTGKVLSRKDNNRLIVQGVNVRKKAVRRSEANPQGGFVELEMPIHASNVMLCANDKPFRAKVRGNSGNKEIYGIVDGKEVTYRPLKAAK